MIQRHCEFCHGALKHPRFSICEDCEKKWNLGAAWADVHWADDPQGRYQDERSPDGRLIYNEMRGHYKRKPGESA